MQRGAGVLNTLRSDLVTVNGSVLIGIVFGLVRSYRGN